jgi:prefoldin subunit 5
MHTRLNQRLHQLRAEFDAGQQMLADLETKQRNLRDTMLRISGAIQILEGLRGAAENGAAQGSVAPGNGVAAAVVGK